MTLATLEADLYRRLGYASSPAAEVTTRLRAFLNETHRDLLGLPGMERLRDATLSLSSTAGQEHLALPAAVARIKAIVDTNNDWALRSLPLQQIRILNPNQTQGDPHSYAVIGRRGVAVQPSDASQVFADSTSGSDTGTAFVEGIRADSYPDTQSVTMTGATAVALGGSDWTLVEEFYLSAAAVGTVTLHEDAEGGTTLATIYPGETRSRYLWLLLEPVPSAVRTYRIDFVREVEDLANANDEPLLPTDFHHLLGVGARAKEYERREQLTLWSAAQSELAAGARTLRYWIAAQGAPMRALPRLGERSQLGSMFPAGS